MRSERKKKKEDETVLPDAAAFEEAQKEEKTNALEASAPKPIAFDKKKKGREEAYPENEYYLKIAAKFKWAKYFAAVLTVVFFLAMISIFRKDITLENFRYLLRDMNTDSTKYTDVYSTIYYDSVGDTDFALFRDYLAVVRPGDTLLYSSEGKTVLSVTNDYIAPHVLSTDSFFLVYDFGQTTQQFSVMNAFSKLYDGKTSAPIAGAAASPTGLFAFILKNADFRGVVEIYDGDFDVISRVYTDRYVTHIAFSDDGTRLLIVSLTDAGGGWVSEVSVVDPYNDQSVFSVSVPGEMLISGAFSGDTVTVSGDGGVYHFGAAGEKLSEEYFSGKTPTDILTGKGKYAVCFNTTILGTGKTVLCTGEGTDPLTVKVDGKIEAYTFSDTDLWIVSEKKLYRFPLSGGDAVIRPIGDGCQRLFMLDDDKLLTCFGNYAEVVLLSGDGETAR
ncbi:MAG: DUF5711 family protein [Lachnospiraceae bacterium]|nr:DUF5711 family protein [Lachnospiraceae bacterium]